MRILDNIYQYFPFLILFYMIIAVDGFITININFSKFRDNFIIGGFLIIFYLYLIIRKKNKIPVRIIKTETPTDTKVDLNENRALGEMLSYLKDTEDES